MEAAVRSLLSQHDDPDGCEFPVGEAAVPSGVLAESVREIQRALRDELAVSMDVDGCVQDASFHDELRILHPDSFRANGVIERVSEIAIRFSNFGRLCTIHSAIPSRLSRYPVDQIRRLVERHGWTYVPADQLDEVYDGQNEVLRNGRNTWWIRFLGYV